ncbi:hypothetical protein E0Z07_11000 [Myroides odoratimimus]|uniref:Uncharacterized protein n=1 Tax=Myroides odoratimimus CIP 101113 TaxID=883154 RepID=A0AAV3F4J0_9FLAO|nr:hypothetical protein HMPREF9715_01311 [Myroides odoratimimus CIP 101113]EPH11731.1 hypothetical protein HMPREF9713_01572 [Myroides odoratimimus CCUG 12700]QBK76833.1 hypothetical protein E0Z07_11000 [Myroides odoratimimus]
MSISFKKEIPELTKQQSLPSLALESTNTITHSTSIKYIISHLKHDITPKYFKKTFSILIKPYLYSKHIINIFTDKNYS